MRPAEILRALERCGMVVMRRRGSHVMLTKPGLSRPVVLAMHNKEISPATIRALLHQAQISPEAFVEES